jgi:hypothetical protein
MCCAINEGDETAATLELYVSAIVELDHKRIALARALFHNTAHAYMVTLLVRHGHGMESAVKYANQNMDRMCGRMLANAMDLVINGRYT